jgi:hypothetical protein
MGRNQNSIQYGSNYEMAQEIILRAGIEVAGDLTVTQKKKWKITSKVNDRRCPTEPMISLVANDKAEYTLRYVVDYKKEGLKNYIVF